MFKSIGFVIALYAITQLMSTTFAAFERAAIATLEAVESAALLSQSQLIEVQKQ